MKKRTLIFIIAGLVAFIWYKVRKTSSVSKATETNDVPASSIAKEEDVAIEPTMTTYPSSVIPDPVGVPATSMPGTIYATYVDLGWTGDGILVNGDKVEVMPKTSNSYFVHKILGNPTYVAGSITLPIDALVF
jgi:hypothetical protein